MMARCQMSGNSSVRQSSLPLDTAQLTVLNRASGHPCSLYDSHIILTSAVSEWQATLLASLPSSLGFWESPELLRFFCLQLELLTSATSLETFPNCCEHAGQGGRWVCTVGRLSPTSITVLPS